MYKVRIYIHGIAVSSMHAYKQSIRGGFPEGAEESKHTVINILLGSRTQQEIYVTVVFKIKQIWF